MYVEIYDKNLNHVGNIINVSYKFTNRTFDFNTATVKGVLNDLDITSSLIAVVCDESGEQQFAGFIKNKKPTEDNLAISFQIDDFKKILDTDMIIDFSQIGATSHELQEIFGRVEDGIKLSTDPASTLLNIAFVIPTDTTDTKTVADYTGKYLIVNGLKFLKVYLSYYGYFIKPSFDNINGVILFTFVKQSTDVVEIKLDDFIHEKTSNDIKLNKVIATISFDTAGVGAPSWLASDLTEYDDLAEGMKGVAVVDLPEQDGLPQGYGMKLYEIVDYVLSDETASIAADTKVMRFVDSETTDCPTYAPSQAEAEEAAGDVDNYEVGTVIKCVYRNNSYVICSTYAIYLIVEASGTPTYYKNNIPDYIPYPYMAKHIYTLGNDNGIYDGYAPEENRILPVVQKIFEAQYLYESQLNAVYELVNNRYIENIIITETDTQNIIKLSDEELYTIIRVYDNNGDYKDIPISEIEYNFKGKLKITNIKLGFKKTLLTEILKGEDRKVIESKTAQEKGLNSYLHIAYANEGVSPWDGFSKTVSAGKLYIGQYTDNLETGSSDPSLYSWTLTKGESVHIAYTNEIIDPWTGFSTTVSTDKLYIGQYTDNLDVGSETPSDYEWTLIKGADGTDGIDGTDGVDGDAGPGLVFRGAFVPYDAYYSNTVRMDVVLYNGTYYALKAAYDGERRGYFYSTAWTPMTAFTMIATDILLAENAAITKGLVIGDSSLDTDAFIRSYGMASLSAGEGFYLEATGKMRLGNIDGNNIYYDGSNLQYNYALDIWENEPPTTTQGHFAIKNNTATSKEVYFRISSDDPWYLSQEPAASGAVVVFNIIGFSQDHAYTLGFRLGTDDTTIREYNFRTSNFASDHIGFDHGWAVSGGSVYYAEFVATVVGGTTNFILSGRGLVDSSTGTMTITMDNINANVGVIITSIDDEGDGTSGVSTCYGTIISGTKFSISHDYTGDSQNNYVNFRLTGAIYQ